MEQHIQHIELINNYLNNKLSKSERQDFENRLKTDAEFNSLYEDHIVFLEGLKRQTLKTEINKAKQIYVRNIWFKYLGISVVVLTVSALIYINLKTDTTIKPGVQPNNNTTTKIVLDSVFSEPVLKDSTGIKDTLTTEKVKVEKQMVSSKIGLTEKLSAEVEIHEKVVQTFTISSEKDTTLICKEGTKLIIKANSFITTDNREIAGKLALNVTEFYKLSDILLANLTTTSNGNLLETGGMLHVEAKLNESILKLKENTSIEIVFPSKVKKENMQLFSGEWEEGIINWTPEKQDIPIVKNEIFEEDVEVPFAVIEQIPVYPGCENLQNTSGKRCMKDSIDAFIQRNFNPKIITNLGLRGRQRINVIFKINIEGEVVAIRTRSSHPDLEREASRVLSLLPKMQPGKQRGKAVTVPYSLPIIFEVDGTTGMVLNSTNAMPIGTNAIRDSIVNMSFEDRLKSKDSFNISVSEVNNYILRSSNLGWINCDRFVNSSNNIKYLLKINDYRGTTVNMVFKSISGVIPSRKINGEFYFKNVPNAQEIVLIAIKKDNGKLYFDIVETQTQTKPSLEFDFKEVTVEELKRELEKLNKSF
ncbi:energy transducer TonB [Yeosuana marina]|uniref:energy transducer TonB n=1 Tax=Yeosuana marina TaxID=1565536 RepID=UPI0014233C3C|nr:energy transducer TonB [Yeosuana marina]